MILGLVKRADKPTNFVLPVYVNGYKTNWYYDCEHDLFKAYYQLKAIRGKYIPSYPVVY